MKFDSCKHQRRSIRLKGYDYAQPGAYFVTLCTWQREDLFGEVVGGDVRLSALGKVVKAEWERLASRFPNIALDAFVVMPNHLHGIIVIHEPDVGATHNMYNVIPSGKSNMQTEFGDPHDGSPKFDRLPESIGSPVDANDGLSGNRGTVTQRATTDSLERENRATRHSPTDASMDVRYEDTEFGECVDGSPLRNDGMDRAPKRPARGSLGAMIGQFKSRVTKRIWAIPEFDHTPIWQRNYYEHIIRNEADWRRTCKYIRENPLRWEEDQLHPEAQPNPFNQDKDYG